MPGILNPPGVPADEERDDMLGEVSGDRQLPAVERRIAETRQPILGNNLQGDEVTARAADDELGVGNLHSGLCIMCQAGWGPGGVGRYSGRLA